MIVSRLGACYCMTRFICIFAAGAQAHQHRPGPRTAARSRVAERSHASLLQLVSPTDIQASLG